MDDEPWGGKKSLRLSVLNTPLRTKALSVLKLYQKLPLPFIDFFLHYKGYKHDLIKP